MANLAVIILTFNEEANLRHALDSVVGWAKEVYVVDSYSTDNTVDIALQYEGDGVRVVQHEFQDYSSQWNWALRRLPIMAEWTLKLDADERATPAFRAEVDQLLRAATTDLDGVLFRRRLFFLGGQLRFSGTQNNYDLRLWRTGRARFEDRPVNEHALVSGKTAKLASFVEHHDYKSLSDWIEKHNRYAVMEATAIASGNVTGDIAPRFWGSTLQRRMWLRARYQRLPWRNFIYFLYRYVAALGFLDGYAGFRYSFLHASYRYWIELEVEEIKRTGKLPELVFPARGTPHPRVIGSELQRRVDGSAAAMAARLALSEH